MTPLTPKIHYHLEEPVAEEELRQYLFDPVASLPPAAVELLPQTGIVLAPWLERSNGKPVISMTAEKPADARLVFSTAVDSGETACLFFTVRSEQVSDYHYYLFMELARLLARRWPEKLQHVWQGLLREELNAQVHGEVDERSWHAKQAILRRSIAARKSGKLFNEYALRAFEDTVTLYLHGLCCDIDVEAGPRQLPSRFLRKRLEALKAMFPPPEGHGVFPEDVSRTRRN